MSDVYNPVNAVSMEFGDVIGARRYLKWIKEGKPARPGELSFDKTDLSKYKEIVPLHKYYNKQEIHKRSVKAYRYCRRKNMSENEAQLFVRFLDRQLKKTVYAEEIIPKESDESLDNDS